MSCMLIKILSVHAESTDCTCTFVMYCCMLYTRTVHSPEKVLVQYQNLADYLQCHYSTLSVFPLINPCSFSYRPSEVNILVGGKYMYMMSRLKSKSLSISIFLHEYRSTIEITLYVLSMFLPQLHISIYLWCIKDSMHTRHMCVNIVWK